tara:strand:+ start:556 stop:954 length:399 start_codon:yes stop_codon:yes gene_type:complete
MVDQEVDDLIVGYVERFGDSTFPKLLEFVDQATEIDPYGEINYFVRANGRFTNCMVWHHMSEEFLDVWDRLWVVTNPDGGRLKLHPMGAMETMIIHGYDGSPMLNLPIAKRPPKNGYKKPRWLPCLVKPVKG